MGEQGQTATPQRVPTRFQLVFGALVAALIATLALLYSARIAADVPPEPQLGAGRSVERSAKQVRAFRSANPCPATGAPRGACPGWVVDHVVPLCAGGADAPHNMQWQSVAEAKAKDREEHATCRKLRKEGR